MRLEGWLCRRKAATRPSALGARCGWAGEAAVTMVAGWASGKVETAPVAGGAMGPSAPLGGGRTGQQRSAGGASDNIQLK